MTEGNSREDRRNEHGRREEGDEAGGYYQIYGNAAKLVGYATQPDGPLKEITSMKIPYNSPHGLAGI